MDIQKQKLLIEQTDRKMDAFKSLKGVIVPPNGWVNTIRIALKMSLRQLASRLKITPQSVKEIEEREVNGTISLKVLKEVGAALDMKFIYGFIPINSSLEDMIEKRATEIAKEIVLRTSHTMQLEDQENSRERLEKAIKNRAEELKQKMPKYLWD